jgi:chromosome segregation ATPase
MLRRLRRSWTQLVEGVTGQERRRVQGLKQVLGEATTECEQLKRTINSLERKSNTLNAQQILLLTQLGQSNLESEQAQAKLQAQTQEISLLRNQLQQQVTEAQGLRQSLTGLQTLQERQAQTLLESSRRQQALESQCQAQQHQWQSAQVQWQETQAQWQTTQAQYQAEAEAKCDRLTRANQELQATSQTFSQSNLQLQQTNLALIQEHQALLQIADEDVQHLETDNQQLRQDNQALGQRLAQLQGQIAALRGNGAIEIEPLVAPLPAQPNELLATLGNLRLALVGGHQSTRRGVIQELSQTYGLKDVVELEPFCQESTALNKVRAKLGNCDWVFVITGYLSHKETKTVSTLRERGALPGKVYLIKARGRSGVIREIIEHMTNDSRLRTAL